METIEMVAIYGAVTGTLSLLATIGFKALAIWRDRAGISVKAKVIMVSKGAVLEPSLGISVYGRRRPATVTGAGVIMPGLGGLTRTFSPVHLTEGQNHTFDIPFTSVRQALSENPLVKPPRFAYAEALGRTYKTRLTWYERYFITGTTPHGLTWNLRAGLNRVLPWRKNKFAAFEGAISRQRSRSTSEAGNEATS